MDEQKIKSVITSIMDYLEEAVGSMTVVHGRKILYVFVICVVFTLISGLLELAGFYTFISLPEGSIASVFSLIMSCIGYKNVKVIESIKLRFKGGGQK